MTQQKRDAHFHIPSLDGIRAVAALTVFFSHAGNQDLIPGGFGVTIFFFLSGYLITTLLRREHEAKGAVSLKNFYIRRAFRLFPPLYIVLFVVLILSFLGVFTVERMTFGGVLSQLAYWSNYYWIFSDGKGFVPGTGLTWSLSVEEHFYLVFPLLFLFLVSRFNYPAMAKVLMTLCAVVLLWRLILVLGFSLGHDYIYHATDTRFDSILYGCILGIWNNPIYLNPVETGQDRTPRKSHYLMLVCAIGLLLFTFLYRDEVFRETWRYSIQGVALFPIFWMAVRYSDLWLFRWLDLPFMRLFGLISYTFYLCHLVILHWVERYLGHGTVLWVLASFVLAFGFSYAMHIYIEKPVGRLRKKLQF